MNRRAVVLCGLFIVGSQLSAGCCCWRPFLFRGCWPHCYSPNTVAAAPVMGDPGCACYSAPYAANGAPAMNGQPVYLGPAVPLGQPQVTPSGGVPNPMAPNTGTPKN